MRWYGPDLRKPACASTQTDQPICHLLFGKYHIISKLIAQSVTCLATDACLTADQGVTNLIPVRSHTFVEIDHELISTVILLPSADSFVPRRYFFCGSFMFLFCLMFAMSLCASVYMCFVVTSWERADLLALVCGIQLWVCNFPIGILGRVWYLIVSTPDLCTLTYFVVSYKRKYEHELLVNRLFKPAQEKVWLGEMTVPPWP